MAYDFVDKAISGKTQPSVAKPISQPVQKVQNVPMPAPIMNQRQPANIHGKFMSGGLVSKGMDLLRTPEYAIASFSKGQENEIRKMKTQGTKFGLGALTRGITAGVKNILPGVSTRTQFGREAGDYNAGSYVTKNKAAQSGINFGLSLAAPTLPVGKIAGVTGKIISKAPGAGKVANLATKITSKASAYAKATPSVYNTLEKVPGMEHFRNPAAGKILNEAKDTAEVRISSLYNAIKDTAKGLTPAQRVRVGQIMEGGISKDPALVRRANYIREISDKIGQEVVDSGLMSPESFAKFKGKYLSHIADVVRTEEGAKFSGTKKMLSFTNNALKQRKNILGSGKAPDYVREFQFPTFKALAGEVQNVESVKAVKKLAEKFGSKLDEGEELVKSFTGPRTTAAGEVLLSDVLPTKLAKQFKGVKVPQEIADYVTRKYARNAPNLVDKVASKALNTWKLGKTVYSGPAYHGRNLISNQILSDFSTGAGLPKTVKGYAKSVKTYMGKGDSKMNKYMQELKDAGVVGRQSISEGINALKPSVFGQGESKLTKALRSPMKFQNASEETAKLNVFAHFRDKGMSIEQAAKKAQEAIFSPHLINKTERGLVKNTIPFYSFTRQAAPFIGKTAVRNGGRIVKYEKAKTAIEGLSAGEGENLPDNMKGQVRLPIKDKNGKNIYADPKFILPYGNFDDTTGGLSLNPALTETGSQIFNKDSYFGTPIAKSAIPERAKAQRIQHAVQTFAPNILPTDFAGGIPSGQPGLKYKTRGGSKLYDAFTGQPDYAGRTRSKTQAVLDTFGLKSSSVSPDQPKFDASERNKQIKSLQSERRSILSDKRLKPKEKAKLMQQLNESLREILTSR